MYDRTTRSMNNDPGSLSNLQDIVLPDPVPLWPPGSGGLLVLAALVLCVAVIALRLRSPEVAT